MVEIEVSRVQNHSRGISASLLIAKLESDGPKLLVGRIVNLQTSKTALAKELALRHAVDWEVILEDLCFKVIAAWKQGDPMVWLGEVEPEPFQWLLEPLLEYGGPTTLFGPGGSGKSTLALALGLAVASDTKIIGEAPCDSGPVMYLDWEADVSTHARRLHGLCAGLGIEGVPRIAYRRMVAPLTETVDYLVSEFRALHITMAIIDSFSLARGGDLERGDLAIPAFAAIRQLRVPCLIIDHVNRETMKASQRGHLSPYGSIRTENISRGTWSVHAPEEPEGNRLPIILKHQKTNNDKRQLPIGLELVFEDGLIRITNQDTRTLPQFDATASLGARILETLRHGGPAGQTEIAERLEEGRGSVGTALSRLRGKGKIVQLDQHRYGLAAREDVEPPAEQAGF